MPDKKKKAIEKDHKTKTRPGAKKDKLSDKEAEKVAASILINEK